MLPSFQSGQWLQSRYIATIATKSHNMQLNWLCSPGYRHNNLCPETNIGTKCSFMMYVVVMLLWLLIGNPAEVENKGFSVWPDNTVCSI